MVIEDQESISAWADQTFGPASSNARVAARANEEMAKLLRALTADDNHDKAAEEVADVVIVLCRLMTRMGRNLGEEVARKMAIAINRARQWNLTADGHGYHVRDKTVIGTLASAMKKFAPDLAEELVK
jgi:NTP pyrophosphatase (non-canonical NTP hydrolase)